MKYKKFIDNKSKFYGETITDKGIMRVNMKMSNNTPFTKTSPIGVAGQADTVYHEQLHAAHPGMLERTVRRKTKIAMNKMDTPAKRRLVANYKKQAKQITQAVRKQFHNSQGNAK